MNLSIDYRTIRGIVIDYMQSIDKIPMSEFHVREYGKAALYLSWLTKNRAAQTPEGLYEDAENFGMDYGDSFGSTLAFVARVWAAKES